MAESMMSMYQIGRMMQDQEARGRAPHPDTNLASGFTSALGGFTQGQKDYTAAEEAKIERAKKLMALSGSVQAYNDLKNIGGTDPETDQLHSQMMNLLVTKQRQEDLNKANGYDVNGNAIVPDTSTASSRVMKGNIPGVKRKITADSSGFSSVWETADKTSALDQAKINTQNALTKKYEADADYTKNGKGKTGSGGKFTGFTDPQLFAAKLALEKQISNILIDEEDKIPLREDLDLLNAEKDSRNIGQPDKPPKASGKIKVIRISDGATGSIDAKDYDPKKYKKQ